MTASAIKNAMTIRNWLAVAAVATGTFLVVTVENLPMGLLSAIGNDLEVSDSAVALLVTASGLVAAMTAAFFPVMIRRLDRRIVLMALILLMVIANLIIALSPHYAVILMARLLVGVSIGGFWALAAGLAVRLVPPRYVARATSMVFLGAMAANVLGVPIGTLIGNLTNWQLAFGVMSGIGALLIAVLYILLPKIPADTPVHFRTLVQQLRSPVVRTGVISTFLLVGGHYGAFTFASPILQQISGIEIMWIAPLLFAFGAAGIAGNLIAGALVGRNVQHVIVVISLLLALVLALFPFFGTNPWGGSLLFIVWGVVFGGLPVSVQTWILKAAPTAPEAATGLNTSMFNLAIAVGALSGSMAVQALSLTGALFVMASSTLLTAILVKTTRSARSLFGKEAKALTAEV